MPLPWRPSIAALRKRAQLATAWAKRLPMPVAFEPPKDRHPIDVGDAGIDGHYTKMLGLLRDATSEIIVNAIVWRWFLTFPLGTVIYRISPNITVIGLIGIALAVWTFSAWQPVAKSAWHAVRWLTLESQGLQWVTVNGHKVRVVLRRADGETRYDRTLRKERVDQEVSCIRHRNESLKREISPLIRSVVTFLILPLIFSFIFELMGPGVRTFFEHWHVEPIFLYFFFYGVVVISAVPVIWTLFDGFVHWTGAQFIPGAKVFDPPVAETSLETIQAQGVHGLVPIMDPIEGARRMAE
jgi:hypothetical protein